MLPHAGFQSPVLISKVAAEYTPQARQVGIEGTVLLRVALGKHGRAHDISVLQGVGNRLDTMQSGDGASGQA